MLGDWVLGANLVGPLVCAMILWGRVLGETLVGFLASQLAVAFTRTGVNISNPDSLFKIDGA